MAGETQLKVVNFQPGFLKNTTAYTAENNWIDGDKVRFRNGRPEKIGGWVRKDVSQAIDSENSLFTGVSRNVLSWVDLAFNAYFVSGSNEKVELLFNDTIYNITPFESEHTLTDAISTTNASPIVTISHSNHGLNVGDYVYVVSQASVVDGIDLSVSTEYKVSSVVDSSTYTLTFSSNATGTTSGGGGDLEIKYFLEVGDVDNGNLSGYSGGTYDTPGANPITNVSLTDAISTTSGSSTITINDTAHGLSVGDFITVVSQQTSVDGIDLSDENTYTLDFEVLSVPTADTYTIKAINNVTLVETNATGTTSGGGGDLELQYGGEGWSAPRDGSGGVFLRQWSFDNWGEDLIACPNGGKIYQWDATNGPTENLVQVTNAPTENSLILVAQPSRHLVAFGTQLLGTGEFDPLVIRWASQETLTEWTPTSSNTAGEYRLPLGNYIVGAIQTKNEILVLTDDTVYGMRFVGGNEVFRFEILANNTSIVSQNCLIDIDGIVYWMGSNGFYAYDGVVRTLGSSLDEAYFSQSDVSLENETRLNFDQKEKTFCSSIKEYNEIIWLLPVEGDDEISRYILYNYLTGTWYDGTLDRTVWLDRKLFPRPFAIDSNGVLYSHELGKDADGSPLVAYLRSGDIDLDEGQNLMFIDRFIPDFKLVPNRLANLYLYLKKWPNSTAVEKGPYAFTGQTKQINLRARARHVSIKYEVNVLGADFEVGSPRFAIQPDGGR